MQAEAKVLKMRPLRRYSDTRKTREEKGRRKARQRAERNRTKRLTPYGKDSFKGEPNG